MSTSSTTQDKTSWRPDSWREKEIAQDVIYPSQENLETVLRKLRHLPPIVTPTEIVRLRAHLAKVSKGEAFLLQGGDCAEIFDGCSMDPIQHKLSLVLLMSLIVIWGGRLPVVRIMRIAGQYAKPRSKPTETHPELGEVLSYRGDNINGFSPDDRSPDPDRLLGAYFHSTTTLNYIRALIASDFASLHSPKTWEFSHVRSPTLQAEFEQIVDRLEDALDFMETIGAGTAGGSGSMDGVEIFTSHEGLSLEFEECLTRCLPDPERKAEMEAEEKRRRREKRNVKAGSGSDSGTNTPSRSRARTESGKPGKDGKGRDPVEEGMAWFNAGCHYLWIGDRTRQIDGAHVEYFRGLKNPIGIKVGPTMPAGELTRLLDVLDPNNEPGKVSLITRYGAGKIDRYLPSHIDEVVTSGHPVLWVCDPMHGNTKTAASSSLKTRAFNDIVQEITRSMAIHSEKGTILGGVHLELTGEVNEDGFSVTECTGGSMELADEALSTNYQSHCDPRLNFEQSLDVAFLISDSLKGMRKRGGVSEETLIERLRGRVEARRTAASKVGGGEEN